MTKRWHSAVPTPPRPVPDPGASRRGVEVHTGHCFARPWEPSPLPSPRGRGSKAGVRRMVVGLCPLPFALCPLPFALCPLLFALSPCLRLRLCLGLGLCVGWCWPDAGLIEREDRSMRHACCAFPCSRGAGRSTKDRSVGQGLPGQAQPERWPGTSPSTAPRNSSLSPWERAGVRAPRPSEAMARIVFSSPLSVPRSAAGGVRVGSAACPRFVI